MAEIIVAVVMVAVDEIALQCDVPSFSPSSFSLSLDVIYYQ